MGLHVVQELLVDALRRPPQGEFPEGREVARRKVVLDGAFGGLREVDLALVQTLDQVIGGDVDDLDIVGPVDDGIRHRLADADARDLGDDIVQAFDVLDIHRRIDVDAPVQQLENVEIALRMTAAGRIRMRQLVDQGEPRPALQHRIEVHLLQRLPLVGDLRSRDDLEIADQSLGFLAPVRLDDADDNVLAVDPAGVAGDEHLVGLADARRGSQEDLQTAARLLRRLFKQGFGRRPLRVIRKILWAHCPLSVTGYGGGARPPPWSYNLSSARLSSRTLTMRLSVRKPPGAKAASRTSAWTRALSKPRASAIRGIW